MHIRAITPIRVDNTQLARRRARYERLAPTGITSTMENLPAASQIARHVAAPEDVWNDTVARVTRRLATTDVPRVLTAYPAVDVRPDASGVAVLDPARLALDRLSLAREYALVGIQEGVARG